MQKYGCLLGAAVSDYKPSISDYYSVTGDNAAPLKNQYLLVLGRLRRAHR